MKSINFEIVEDDIKWYLEKHKDDENLKYRGALFITYISNTDFMTKEKLEILIKKYVGINTEVEGTYYDYHSFGGSKCEPLPSFKNYLKKIKNLDITGITHILVPAFRYYSDNRHIYANHDIFKLYHMGLFEEFNTNNSTSYVEFIDNIRNTLKNTCSSYEMLGKLEYARINNNIHYNNMSKDWARKELFEYSKIYGEEEVKIIKKYVREESKLRD